MNRWNGNQPPTIEEVSDYEYCFVNQGNRVTLATGSTIRLLWMRSINAWEEPPTAFQGEHEDLDAAEHLVELMLEIIQQKREAK